MAFIVTVNEDAVVAGDDQAVRVQQEDGTIVGEYTEVVIEGSCRVRTTGAPRPDGSRVWIECAHVRPLT